MVKINGSPPRRSIVSPSDLVLTLEGGVFIKIEISAGPLLIALIKTVTGQRRKNWFKFIPEVGGEGRGGGGSEARV